MLFSLKLLDVAEGLDCLYTNSLLTKIFTGVGVFFLRFGPDRSSFVSPTSSLITEAMPV